MKGTTSRLNGAVVRLLLDVPGSERQVQGEDSTILAAAVNTFA